MDIDLEVEVSPNYRPKNIVFLIIGTPKKVHLILGNPQSVPGLEGVQTSHSGPCSLGAERWALLHCLGASPASDSRCACQLLWSEKRSAWRFHGIMS